MVTAPSQAVMPSGRAQSAMAAGAPKISVYLSLTSPFPEQASRDELLLVSVMRTPAATSAYACSVATHFASSFFAFRSNSFLLTGSLANMLVQLTVVPTPRAAFAVDVSTPWWLNVSSCASSEGSAALFVTMRSGSPARDASELSASPRNPYEFTDARSSKQESFDVACLRAREA